MSFELAINVVGEKLFTIIAERTWKVRDLRRALAEKLSKPDSEYYALLLGSAELEDDMSARSLQGSMEIKLVREKISAAVGEGRYAIFEQIGSGCFATVSRGRDLLTGKSVAIKVEPENSVAPQLDNEAEIMRALRGPKPPQGFAELLYLGGSPSRRTCLVMEHLGMNLEQYACKSGGSLDCKTVVLVAEQALLRIEYLHSKGYVHRDIKPENFVFGRGSKSCHLYLIDFGLSQTYLSFPGKAHIPIRTKLSLTGTARYASINTHKGLEQSRRDDLEALGHMFFYLLRGNLPWSGIDAKTREEKYRRIMIKKEETPLKKLCDAYPDEFGSFLAYARSLNFSEKPAYKKVYALIQNIKVTRGPWQDHVFQWVTKDDVPAYLEPLKTNLDVRQPDDPEEEKRPKKSMLRMSISIAKKAGKKAEKKLSKIGNAFSSLPKTIHSQVAATANAAKGRASSSSPEPPSPSSRMFTVPPSPSSGIKAVRASMLTRFGFANKKHSKQETQKGVTKKELQEKIALKQDTDIVNVQRIEPVDHPDGCSSESDSEGAEEEMRVVDECVELSDDERNRRPSTPSVKQVRVSSKETVRHIESRANSEESDLSSFWSEGEEDGEEERRTIDHCVEPSDSEMHERWKDMYRDMRKGSWKDREMNIRPIRCSLRKSGIPRLRHREMFEV